MKVNSMNISMTSRILKSMVPKFLDMRTIKESRKKLSTQQ